MAAFNSETLKIWRSGLRSNSSANCCMGLESGYQFKSAVPAKIIFAAAPENGVAEEAADPHQKSRDILHGDQPPKARGQRIAQRDARGGPAGQRPQDDGERERRPPYRKCGHQN